MKAGGQWVPTGSEKGYDMLYLKINNTEIGLDFIYSAREIDGPLVDTTAQFIEPKTDYVLASATAKLHSADQFDRKVGRKLAFKRLVESFTDDYNTRQQLWSEFLKNVRLRPATAGDKLRALKAKVG